MYAITKNSKRLAHYDNLSDAQNDFAKVVAQQAELTLSSTFFDGVVIADDEGLILWLKNDENYYFMYEGDEYEIEEIKI